MGEASSGVELFSRFVVSFSFPQWSCGPELLFGGCRFPTCFLCAGGGQGAGSASFGKLHFLVVSAVSRTRNTNHFHGPLSTCTGLPFARAGHFRLRFDRLDFMGPLFM